MKKAAVKQFRTLRPGVVQLDNLESDVYYRFEYEAGRWSATMVSGPGWSRDKISEAASIIRHRALGVLKMPVEIVFTERATETPGGMDCGCECHWRAPFGFCAMADCSIHNPEL